MEKSIYNINESGLSYGRGYVYSLQYHIVWCTKYRRKVLTAGADEDCKQLLLDLTGMRFGKLTALEPTNERKNGYTIWLCRCDCGNTVHAASRFLKNGWMTSCSCGKETSVCQSSLMSGHTTSCGCRNTPFAAKHFVEGTCVENIRSRRIAKNNTSGVRGVYKAERSGKWCAQITFQGKTRYLGSFSTLEEAAEARKKGEELFDEFLVRFDMEHPRQESGKIPPEELRAETRHIVHVLHSDIDAGKIPV